MRYVLPILLLVAIGYMSDRLVRVENQRYALWVGLCESPLKKPLEADRCLEHVQTRTSWLWHLLRGLTEPMPSVPIWTNG